LPKQNENEIDTAKNPAAEAIGAAEGILDPLDGLVEKTAADPGTPSRPSA
jgi:hypothetical protein